MLRLAIRLAGPFATSSLSFGFGNRGRNALASWLALSASMSAWRPCYGGLLAGRSGTDLGVRLGGIRPFAQPLLDVSENQFSLWLVVEFVVEPVVDLQGLVSRAGKAIQRLGALG